MSSAIDRIAYEVETLREYLVVLAEWRVFSDVGDMSSPNGANVWFSSGYAYGEYTLTASIRPRGSGPALHEIRIRLTDRNTAVNAAEPGSLGLRLAASLAQAAREVADNPDGYADLKQWPPSEWADFGLVHA